MGIASTTVIAYCADEEAKATGRVLLIKRRCCRSRMQASAREDSAVMKSIEVYGYSTSVRSNPQVQCTVVGTNDIYDVKKV
jgi:hypothetical protein